MDEPGAGHSGSERIRSAFLESSAMVADLLGHDSISGRWSEPSALEAMSVGALAAHLHRQLFVVRDYLGAEVPDGAPLDAVSYYLDIMGDDPGDLSMDINVGIRDRADLAAELGLDELRSSYADELATIRTTLPGLPETQQIAVFGALPMALDQYLVTRMVEQAVHADDLAASLSEPTPPLPEGVGSIVVGVLAEIAHRRIGDVPALRALARRERASRALLAF